MRGWIICTAKRLLTVTAIITVTTPVAFASGFRIPEISVAGLGYSNALVANAEEIGAMPYNAAAMSFHEGHTLDVGLININPSIHVDPEVGTATNSQEESSFNVPNFFYKGSVSQKWHYGLAINAPFGLETKWPAGTFGAFAASGVPFLEPEQSKIEMVNINPSFSYRVNEVASLAFGIQYFSVQELVFNTQAIKINGDGDGWGYNLGLLVSKGPWGVGVSYRSKVETDITGSVDATAIGAGSSGAKTQLEFPDMFQIGLRYRFAEAFAVEFDYERTGWSSFSHIVIENDTAVGDITSTNNWENADAYRFGATWNVAKRATIRFGYALDRTPQTDEWFSARVPDADRTLYSIGFAWDGGVWGIEAGYMHVQWDTRNFVGSKTFGVDTGEPNGSNLYNGRYESKANLAGLSVNFKF